jgi:hypothetical protein
MYVFTSAIFFIILFSLQSADKVIKVGETPEAGKGLVALAKDSVRLEKNMAEETDADDKAALGNRLNKLKGRMAMIRKTYGDTTTRTFDPTERGENDDTGFEAFGMHLGQYKSAGQYDSAQRALPDSLRSGWFTRIVARRLIATQAEYHHDKKSWKQHFVENFLHSFPKILFFSLPFFALILNILYFRHKQYYYVDHGIFTIHLYIANFILMLIMVILSKLSNTINIGWVTGLISVLIFLIWVYMLFYLYKAMRGFYKQGRWKTILKYFIACLLAFIVNLMLLMIFLILSAITIH